MRPFIAEGRLHPLEIYKRNRAVSHLGGVGHFVWVVDLGEAAVGLLDLPSVRTTVHAQHLTHTQRPHQLESQALFQKENRGQAGAGSSIPYLYLIYLSI